MYPEYAETDFIEEFVEDQVFEDHLVFSSPYISLSPNPNSLSLISPLFNTISLCSIVFLLFLYFLAPFLWYSFLFSLPLCVRFFTSRHLPVSSPPFLSSLIFFVPFCPFLFHSSFLQCFSLYNPYLFSLSVCLSLILSLLPVYSFSPLSFFDPLPHAANFIVT
jgi:hypothetical protein